MSWLAIPKIKATFPPVIDIWFFRELYPFQWTMETKRATASLNFSKALDDTVELTKSQMCYNQYSTKHLHYLLNKYHTILRSYVPVSSCEIKHQKHVYLCYTCFISGDYFLYFTMCTSETIYHGRFISRKPNQNTEQTKTKRTEKNWEKSAVIDYYFTFWTREEDQANAISWSHSSICTVLLTPAFPGTKENRNKQLSTMLWSAVRLPRH